MSTRNKRDYVPQGGDLWEHIGDVQAEYGITISVRVKRLAAQAKFAIFLDVQDEIDNVTLGTTDRQIITAKDLDTRFATLVLGAITRTCIYWERNPWHSPKRFRDGLTGRGTPDYISLADRP